MNRKQWLTLLYRQANLFLERHAPQGSEMAPAEVTELEPELHSQLQDSLRGVESLEDLIKFSLLKHPPPDLWYGENDWQHVLGSVASACLLHDVKGIIVKILDGTLPRTPPKQLLDALAEDEDK